MRGGGPAVRRSSGPCVERAGGKAAGPPTAGWQGGAKRPAPSLAAGRSGALSFTATKRFWPSR